MPGVSLPYKVTYPQVPGIGCVHFADGGGMGRRPYQTTKLSYEPDALTCFSYASWISQVSMFKAGSVPCWNQLALQTATLL